MLFSIFLVDFFWFAGKVFHLLLVWLYIKHLVHGDRVRPGRYQLNSDLKLLFLMCEQVLLLFESGVSIYRLGDSIPLTEDLLLVGESR